MITEDYVSFRTSRLLKEKGFDEKTERSYRIDRNRDEIVTTYYDWRNRDDCYPQCTAQMAMKWLREVHNLVVNPVFLTHIKIWECGIYYKDSGIDATINACGHIYYGESYELAVENGILYCLNHLLETVVPKNIVL